MTKIVLHATALSVMMSLSTFAMAADKTQLPLEKLSADIVVVETGGTGMAAAASAVENGAKVIVFEKTSLHRRKFRSFRRLHCGRQHPGAGSCR